LPYGSATTSGNDFTLFPGACWSEGNDSAIASGPDGTDGAWVADDFGNLVGGPNGFSARINVWNNVVMNRDWLVTPEFDLGATGHNFAATYSVALTPFTGSAAATFGSDDSVQMLITTDGGLTWTSIRTFDATTTISPTGQTVNVPLAAYSGTIRLAFWATNGTVPDAVDVNFYVDNFTIDGTAGTDSPEALGFTYYPNPTQDVVSFNALEPISRIAVRNMLGQVIQDTKIDALSTQINLATYAAGMYLIEVTTDGRTSVVRIVKE